MPAAFTLLPAQLRRETPRRSCAGPTTRPRRSSPSSTGRARSRPSRSTRVTATRYSYQGRADDPDRQGRQRHAGGHPERAPGRQRGPDDHVHQLQLRDRREHVPAPDRRPAVRAAGLRHGARRRDAGDQPERERPDQRDLRLPGHRHGDRGSANTGFTSRSRGERAQGRARRSRSSSATAPRRDPCTPSNRESARGGRAVTGWPSTLASHGRAGHRRRLHAHLRRGGGRRGARSITPRRLGHRRRDRQGRAGPAPVRHGHDRRHRRRHRLHAHVRGLEPRTDLGPLSVERRRRRPAPCARPSRAPPGSPAGSPTRPSRSARWPTPATTSPSTRSTPLGSARQTGLGDVTNLCHEHRRGDRHRHDDDAGQVRHRPGRLPEQRRRPHPLRPARQPLAVHDAAFTRVGGLYAMC